MIEQGQFVDTSEANKTTLRTLLERYGREVSPRKKSRVDKYYIRNICKYDFVDKVLSHVLTKRRDPDLDRGVASLFKEKFSFYTKKKPITPRKNITYLVSLMDEKYF